MSGLFKLFLTSRGEHEREGEPVSAGVAAGSAWPLPASGWVSSLQTLQQQVPGLSLLSLVKTAAAGQS